MNERVVITGVCGTVGRELLKYYIDKDDYIIAVDNNENDIAILEKSIKHEKIKFIPIDVYDEYTLNIIDKLKPTVIIHAAVLKNTYYNEIYNKYYHDINVNGTIKLIYRMIDSKDLKRFIFLSSDEAYNPTNFFGKDKLEVENILKKIKINGKVIQSVRFPFIVESKGSVYNLFKKQAENNLPLTVTDKNVKKIAANLSSFIVTWNDFYNNVCENGVFNFDIGEEISIYKLANDIIKQTNSNSTIKIIGLREGEVLEKNMVKLNEKEVYNNIFRIY